MKSLTGLWSELAHDCAYQCGTSSVRDIQTMLERVEHEGDSFLTITLPQFCSDFEEALEQKCISANLFLGFKKRRRLPAFLHGFVEQVFDDRTGSLHDRPSVNAIRAIRQLTLVFKKIERETTEARKRNAELSYLNCEVDLERVDESLSAIDRHEFNIAFAELYSPVLNRLNEAIERGEVKPKHGPGSTQDKLLGNRKWLFPKWTERLENVFPYAQYCSHTWMPLSDYRTTTLPMEQEPPVKVVFVPKTQKTPRVIAMEPTHMQYMQQAIMTTLVPLLESSWIGRSQGFSDQLPNRDLAREGSRSRRYATIDLSEASDRVLNSLVLSATRAWPTVQEALQATRSTHSQLPSGKVIKLRKFASMGSALCFPLEVMVFTTLVYMGIARTGAYSRDERYELFMSGEVRVYGDDIIVPADSTSCVEMTLESFGLKVNRSKSFSEGYFRESCGGDYYSGTDVTPVRLRVDLPSRKQHAQQIVSVSATANLMVYGGYLRAGEYLHKLCENILGLYPHVPHGSDILGRESFTPTIHGFDFHLYVPIQKGYVLRSPSPRSPLSGIRALFKALTGDWSDPLHKDHLEHAGRPLSYTLRRARRALA
jgi:hypothetical protein